MNAVLIADSAPIENQGRKRLSGSEGLSRCRIWLHLLNYTAGRLPAVPLR